MADTVTFRLNDKNVTVPKGWTVMQAAKQEKVDIPHFCWHPGLSVAGVCRFCMVHVQGARKLEIACNLQATEGMVVRTDTPEVKEAHKWGLEFHLINHPLDCPVCDQAGECGLQDFYMEVGKYPSQMTRPKVLKPKAVDLGPRLILDTERCILCSRCVRFEEEVTKTNALGIFDRGDRAIIGTYGEEKIAHNYQENLVDICPVGAFTSKKFRFKQRVWFLQEKSTICPGCSTGCKIQVHARTDRRTYYRVKPQTDEAVNGFWMCDKGRDTITHLNRESRLPQAQMMIEGKKQTVPVPQALNSLQRAIAAAGAQHTALLVSAHYTVEEYQAFFDYFCTQLGVKTIYQWRGDKEDRDAFDGILWRGDENPNTAGLLASLSQIQGRKVEARNELVACVAQDPKVLIALCPEVPFTSTWFQGDLAKLEGISHVSLWTCRYEATEAAGITSWIPMKGFAEKTGHFLNYQGAKRELEEAFPSAAASALSVVEAVQQLALPQPSVTL